MSTYFPLSVMFGGQIFVTICISLVLAYVGIKIPPLTHKLRQPSAVQRHFQFLSMRY